MVQAITPDGRKHVLTSWQQAEHTQQISTVSPQDQTPASVEMGEKGCTGFDGGKKASAGFYGAEDRFASAVSSSNTGNCQSTNSSRFGHRSHEVEDPCDSTGSSRLAQNICSGETQKCNSFASMRSFIDAADPSQHPLSPGSLGSSWSRKQLFTSKSTQQKSAAPRQNCRWRLSHMVSSQWFESACGAAIFGNSVLIAYEADYAALHIGNSAERLPIMDCLEAAFTIFYTVELILRWMAHGCALLNQNERLWTMFDTSLVLGAIYHQAAYFTSQNSSSNHIFLRMLRVVKMLKVLRMVRIMRMFKELRLIVASIKGSMKSMLWAIILISIITFIAGVAFLQAATEYLQDHLGNIPEEQAITIQSNWGRLSTAMLTLYMASTGGDSWKGMANSLIPVGYSYYTLFLFYISFFLLVVMNTLTSLFLEATIQNADKDKDTVVRETIRKKKEYMKRAAELFEILDADGSGEITEEEFEMHAKDPEMVAFASSLDVDVTDIAQFYDVLSCQGKFKVDCETFVVGCMASKGSARSLDMQGVIAVQKRTEHNLAEIAGECRHILAQIESLNQHKKHKLSL